MLCSNFLVKATLGQCNSTAIMSAKIIFAQNFTIIILQYMKLCFACWCNRTHFIHFNRPLNCLPFQLQFPFNIFQLLGAWVLAVFMPVINYLIICSKKVNICLEKKRRLYRGIPVLKGKSPPKPGVSPCEKGIPRLDQGYPRSKKGIPRLTGVSPYSK